jgi:nicotinamide-nucleotide amidase
MKVHYLASAEIVAVGTEILLGSLVDTNTAWLSQRLAASGIAVYRHTAVGDDRGQLVAALSEAAARADLVLSTGGLGPTTDDLTNEALGQAAGREMVEYPEARRHVDRAFLRFTGREPPPSAYKQALFPEGSELIANPLGTAMGALLELDGVLFATLPGVPAEMRRMFEEALERGRDRLRGARVRRDQRGGVGRGDQRPSRLLGSYARPVGRPGRGRPRGGPHPSHHQGSHTGRGQQEDRTRR